MTLTDAGHGDVLGLQRKRNALLLWVNWTHYSGSTRFRDLVRFQWKSGTYNWSTRPPAFKIMPKVGSLQTVQAKLDPTGTYLVYRISGSGQDRYERRRVVDVENNVRTVRLARLAHSPSPRRELQHGLEGSLRDARLRNP
jgi:hypothetical protein